MECYVTFICASLLRACKSLQKKQPTLFDLPKLERG